MSLEIEKLGRTALNEGRYKDALACYEKLAKVKSDSHVPFYWWGYCKERLGRDPSPEYLEATIRNNEFPEVAIRKGILARALGDLEVFGGEIDYSLEKMLDEDFSPEEIIDLSALLTLGEILYDDATLRLFANDQEILLSHLEKLYGYCLDVSRLNSNVFGEIRPLDFARIASVYEYFNKIPLSYEYTQKALQLTQSETPLQREVLSIVTLFSGKAH